MQKTIFSLLALVLPASGSALASPTGSITGFVKYLPFGPGRRLLGWNNGLNRQVFGGWQISGITTIQSGSPFTVFTSSVADFSGFNLFNDRPDVTRSGPLPTNYSDPDRAFDTTYFGITPAGRAGSSGRNQYYGPGLQNFDFALANSFPLREANIFNHTNFSNPVNNRSNRTPVSVRSRKRWEARQPPPSEPPGARSAVRA